MNTFKENKEKSSKPKKASNNAFAKNFLSILDGSFLTKGNVMKFLPFILFLTLLAIFYIGNSYYAEKTIREVDALNKELKELRSEFITSKSALMFRSKQSEVASAVADLGIEESRIPPKKIVITPGQLNEE